MAKIYRFIQIKLYRFNETSAWLLSRQREFNISDISVTVTVTYIIFEDFYLQHSCENQLA